MKLPANATAKIGQTSLLGTQHVELAPPRENPSPQPLRNGDTIPLKNASAYPTVERTLATLAVILHGGGIPDLDVIQTEVLNLLDGRVGQIREFLNRLDTFTVELNRQRDDLTRAIDLTNQLLSIAADRSDTLIECSPKSPLVTHFAEKQELFGNAIESLGKFSDVADATLSATRTDLHRNLQLLQRALKQLLRAAPYVVGSLRLALTAPYTIDNVPKVIRGDYINVSGTADLTLSTLDNALLSGTGVSGMLRALEQSWGATRTR